MATAKINEECLITSRGKRLERRGRGGGRLEYERKSRSKRAPYFLPTFSQRQRFFLWPATPTMIDKKPLPKNIIKALKLPIIIIFISPFI